MSTKPSKTFIEWINSMHKNSPLYYIVKDDDAVKSALKNADKEEKENIEDEDDKKSYLKYAQCDTTQINN